MQVNKWKAEYARLVKKILFVRLILLVDNVTKPRILLNSTTGISVLSLTNVNVSNAGVYQCSSKNSITNDLEVQVSDYS